MSVVNIDTEVLEKITGGLAWSIALDRERRMWIARLIGSICFPGGNILRVVVDERFGFRTKTERDVWCSRTRHELRADIVQMTTAKKIVPERVGDESALQCPTCPNRSNQGYFTGTHCTPCANDPERRRKRKLQRL